MDEFTDDIYYSILANAPYLLEEGKSIEEIEQSVQNDYQLDYSIDRELSDPKSIVFKSNKDKEVVHAIRGTTTIEDLITDASLMEKLLTHLPTYPEFQKGVGTYATIMGTPLSTEAGVSAMEMSRQKEAIGKAIMFGNAFAINDYEEALKWGSKEAVDYLWGSKAKNIKTSEKIFSSVKPLAESLKPHMGFSEMKLPKLKDFTKILKPITGIVAGSYLAGKAIGGIQKYRFPDGVKNPRIIEEQAKFDKIKSKYSDANFVFTGHSLGGSVSNYLSREHGHKAITFNPAPQLELADQFHKDSKIYKTRADFASLVSIFDKEQRRLVPQKVLRPHSLDNFIPPKIARRTIVPKVERQNAFVDSPPKKCLENPELPECKSYYYV